APLVRCFVRSADHGRYGTSRFDTATERSWSGRLFGVQTPERSGWPSAAFGAGAFTSTLPSGVFGMPAVGVFSHCAPSASAAALIGDSFSFLPPIVWRA